MEDLKINEKLTKQILVNFIQNEIRKIGFKKVILGLSGGIDSSCVAFLSQEALGAKNVWAIIMPYRTSSPESLRDAEAVVKKLGINKKVIDITEQIDTYFKNFKDISQIRRGNKMARERMSILYDLSVQYNALVIGTSNKTELLLGYGTIYGDMACAINPIGDLYKTQVRQLAKYLGIPSRIIKKPPTADLWVGQEDEKELGFTYEEADRFLYLMVDKRLSNEELVKLGYKKDFIENVYKRIQRAQYKRRPPLIAKLSERTIEQDFRYPRD
ncbi:MAG: NAD+ synthase [Candidatus Omnitrophica bacterium]|nr:NAD+ synthase [Candidatus Omnitrophota bacterium]